jgi:hypothetical protein
MARKGFEIAISTLVVFVLGITIIAAGILLLRNISGGGEELTQQITNSQRGALRDLLNQGELVAVYPASVKADTDHPASVGLMVINTHDARADGKPEQFSIQSTVQDEQGADASSKIAVRYLPTLDIARNEQKEAVIVIRPAADAQGTYTVIVAVHDGDTQVYDSPRFFTVHVE